MKGYLGMPEPLRSLGTDVPTLIALLVCLIPTTIGALLAAIGIAGMDRALQANIIAKSGKAVELAGDIDVVLLDKTGTITIGNRNATEFLPIGAYTAADVAATRRPGVCGRRDARREKHREALREGKRTAGRSCRADAQAVPFTAQTRMSGVDLPDGRHIRKGASGHGHAVRQGEAGQRAGGVSTRSSARPRPKARRPLVVADGATVRRCGRARRHPEAPHERALRAACGRWGSGPS